jgi:hypothetical protein
MKDQQRGEQEASAYSEHAGQEADRDPHPEDEKDVYWQVGNRKIDLHANTRGLRAQPRT